MTKRFITILALIASVCLGLKASTNVDALIPMPNTIVNYNNSKPFVVKSTLSIYTNMPGDAFCISALSDVLNHRFGNVKLSITAVPSKADIMLFTDGSNGNAEHYNLCVTTRQLVISGANQNAITHGVMTLDQIILADDDNTEQRFIEPITVDDAPRFGYRAMMLDPARHFLPVADVKRFIDQMMRFKFNVLQLHLTDDQGWRIEIKKHPELTEGDIYYSQQDISDLVNYAAKRGIEIVPEIDIPGHTAALLRKHPEMTCAENDSVATEIADTGMALCSACDSVYALCSDVIKEVSSLFPSERLHLGGDETAIESNWGRCYRCRSLMSQMGYEKPEQLMNFFFGRILADVKAAGKTPILWCELDSITPPANEYLFDYPQDATLVTWRNGLTPKCLELTRSHGNKIIMAPGEYAYFDYPQWRGDLPEFNNWGMPITSLEKVYSFDPGYGLPADEQQHIEGVMATLWGEAISDIDRAFYMAFPRAMAMAEAAWTEMPNRSWDSFKQRLYPNIMELMKQGVPVRAPFEIAR